ncbi:CD48 antigen [Labeo rohita]|uniref:CD48 antigen n=1 Tax=Labeo rohita TaxID=84645 RepID=UPI0021E30A6E|nr:CD48 antigen [Labeo rohita]
MENDARVFGDSNEIQSVTEGDSVILHPGVTEILKADLIMWNLGTNGPLIAKLNRLTNESSINDDVLDGRFRDRLKLDQQTGSLTITNIKITESGLYQVTISSKTKTKYRYSVTVYARLPVPVIINDSPQNSSSSSYCSLLCSVVNVSDVSLSWYKGNSLWSNISVSDHNNSLSLRLECLDDSYSCVVNNPISNQTKYVNITQLCQPCSDCVFCCYASEAITRLTISVLVGVATVVVVVYDITSRKAQSVESYCARLLNLTQPPRCHECFLAQHHNRARRT